MDDAITIQPPVFLITGSTTCFRCGVRFEAAAIAASCIEEGVEQAGLLSFVENFPSDLLAHIQQRVPAYSLEWSRTAERQYYGNTCPNCGVLNGDYYLHSPDGVFAPLDEEAAATLAIEKLPVDGPITVRSGIAYSSSLDMVLARGSNR